MQRAGPSQKSHTKRKSAALVLGLLGPALVWATTDSRPPCTAELAGRMIFEPTPGETTGTVYVCTSSRGNASWTAVALTGTPIVGATGAQGAVGATGADGAAGAQGAQGPQGAQGNAGSNGAQGPQGVAGVDGAAGPQGTAGSDGSDNTLKFIADVRLSLHSTTAVTTSDVTAATTVYLVAFPSGQLALYDGSSWDVYTLSASASLSVPATTNTNFDIFATDSGGDISLEAVSWTNNTTRATDLSTQDGILVKSGDATRRYMGTARTTASSGQTEDSTAKRYLWNYYNRKPRSMRYTATTNHTYSASALRNCNNSSATRVEFVVGHDTRLDGFISAISNGTYGSAIYFDLGYDRTGADGLSNARIARTWGPGLGFYRSGSSAGYHYLQCVESMDEPGTTTGVYGIYLTATVEG